MITADAQQLEPGGRVTLFELDARAMAADQLWFHQHLQSGVIWWQGQQYGAWPIEASGFARTGDQQPAPRLKVGNIDGRIGVMCQLYDDLVGARIVRRQTLVKYLDSANWPRVNLLYSSDLSRNDRWSANGAGYTRSSVAGPDGRPGAVRIVRSTGAGAGYVNGIFAATINRIALPANGQFLLSFWFKSNDGASLRVSRTASTGEVTLLSVPAPQVGVWARYDVPLSTAAAMTGVGPVFYTAGSCNFDISEVQISAGPAAQPFQAVTDGAYVGNPTADPGEFFPDEIWFIERKVAETKEFVEFELATAIDLNGEVLPGRQILASMCTWLLRGGYRGPYCGYAGPAYFDINDNPVSGPGQDVCAGLVRSCKRRFGDNNELPYGGFPAAGLVRT